MIRLNSRPDRSTWHRSALLCAFCVLVLCTLPLSNLQAQVKSPFPFLPTNFDTTVNNNYRGARITSRAQLDSMRRRYNISTVINLAKDALPKKGPTEIEWTKELGMEYVSVYLGSSPPSEKNWQKIRDLLSRGGVYVHCAHGADRTGAIIAKYRIEVEGMEPCDAYREARRFGFKPWLKELRAWIGCEKGQESK
ncbi:dual specificity protein phosphatase family protein [bacterium]|nr:dual specificity protein phosphatase family protein [bacterium]